ncbi:AraC family transcriptional regulator [Gordonia aichiensis]
MKREQEVAMMVTTRRSSVGLALLVDLGREFGVPVADSLRGTGLSEAQAHDLAGEIDAAQELQVARTLLATCDEPCLGLLAGARYNLTTYGSWGLGMATSATVRDATQLAIRYLALTHSFCRMSLAEIDATACLHIDADDVPADLRVFCTERSAAAAFMTARDALTTLRLDRAEFDYPAPPDADRYDLFDAPIRFGADRTRLVFDRTLLDQPMPRANVSTTRWYERQARDLLDRRSPHPTFTTRIRAYLLEHPVELPSATETAADFGIGTRTLTRRLTAEGTTSCTRPRWRGSGCAASPRTRCSRRRCGAPTSPTSPTGPGRTCSIPAAGSHRTSAPKP